MSDIGPVRSGAVNSAPPAGETSARLLWVGLVAGLLLAQIVMCAVAATLATGDPSSAVVPGYHDRALRWDETVATERASDALGWGIDIAPSMTADVLGRRDVTVAIRDRSGAPVGGAAVEAAIFHHVRAGEVREVSFHETADPGTYAATTEMRRDGLWEFRTEANRGDERFVSTRIIDLHTDGAR